MDDRIYSDLALESSYAMKAKLGEADGYREYERDGFKICKLDISSDELSKKYQREAGRYITVVCGQIWSLSDKSSEILSSIIANELKEMLVSTTKRKIDKSFSVLVAGLGNAEITPDAIGPLTVSNLTVTRHINAISRDIFDKLGQCNVSAIAPGVLAQTGIETLEIIRGAVNTISPDAVIAVDALAARSCDRLGSTVQISDSGISPGSGIGNLRRAINQKNLGVPVIALGVPTVVDSSTLVYDALEKAGIESPPKLREILDNGRGFFVSPKEGDIISESVSLLLSHSLDTAFCVI